MAVRMHPAIAPKVFWSSYDDARGIFARARRLHAEIWLANDCLTLPIAASLAAENGGVYSYDTHEFATEEYAQQWKWWFWKRPLIRALERRFIEDAAIVSAVSAGVAQRLDRMYRLTRPSLAIRNTPGYEEARFCPTGERIRVLYHGIVAPGRGLEAAVDSVSSWRPEFDFAIRGPENSKFSNALRARIDGRGLSSRVALLPPVPMTELVRAAMPFDIGFFALPGHSHHNKFALPNKFFEYVMAGLALCVSDLPEMAELVRRYGLGVLIPDLDPAAIADTINALGRDQIDAFKRNSLRAARELCWEEESERLLQAYDSVLSGGAADEPSAGNFRSMVR
ncbi:MAG TPA: glycosyltransferase [Stellaceae bacterium]|nr:glycosyltransferase [Stellaceae bacterium]